MASTARNRHADERSEGREPFGDRWPLAPPEILRFQSGHRLVFFDRGRDALDAMHEAIDRATDHIHFETYILRDDRTGRRMIDHLAERARAGLSVRVILDAIGSRKLDPGAIVELEESGAHVVAFNPPSQWFWRMGPRQRDHRKLLIVDGRIAFLGGLNIGNEYVGEDSDGPTWRDAHVRIEGPALTELQALFFENWFRCDGESFDWRWLFAPTPEAYGDHSVAVIADGPTYRRRRMRSFFIDELKRAKSHVLLVSPYFAPGPRVLEALAGASERGVDVKVLIAGHSDHPILRRAVRAIVPKLLECGVRVFEDPRRMMHAKLAAFDDALAVVGTSNLDRQSLDHSCEVNLVIQGEDSAQWIFDHFATDALDLDPIDKASLERRSLVTRWIDRGASIAARL